MRPGQSLWISDAEHVHSYLSYPSGLHADRNGHEPISLRLRDALGESLGLGSSRRHRIAVPGSDLRRRALGLDVFEHIESDEPKRFGNAPELKPGGLLVLKRSRIQESLWGPHDVALHHFRRYRRQQVIDCLRSS